MRAGIGWESKAMSVLIISTILILVFLWNLDKLAQWFIKR